MTIKLRYESPPPNIPQISQTTPQNLIPLPTPNFSVFGTFTFVTIRVFQRVRIFNSPSKGTNTSLATPASSAAFKPLRGGTTSLDQTKKPNPKKHLHVLDSKHFNPRKKTKLISLRIVVSVRIDAIGNDAIETYHLRELVIHPSPNKIKAQEFMKQENRNLECTQYSNTNVIPTLDLRARVSESHHHHHESHRW